MLNPDVAAFIEGGQSIHLGTRNQALESFGVRVIAATVDADRTHVTAYLLQKVSHTTIENLATNGQAALCFGRPSDDHACQVKGTFVDARAVAADERAMIEAQRDRLLQQFALIGLPRELVAGWPTWPCIAVRLKVTAVFNQTPGPGAGAPLL